MAGRAAVAEGPSSPHVPLYERLLGPDWAQLDGRIRRAHTTGRGFYGTGAFRVTLGPHRAAGLVAKLLRLPTPAPNVVVQLEIESCAGGERWNRTFDGRRLNSRQYFVGPGVMRECVGCIALEFQLIVEDSRLIYQQTRAGLRIGSRLVPLPAWMLPTVSATEELGFTSVSISVPGVGPVLTYAGTIELQEGGR
jgi:hypothetical protein